MIDRSILGKLTVIITIGRDGKTKGNPRFQEVGQTMKEAIVTEQLEK
jgi:hypothetical protein